MHFFVVRYNVHSVTMLIDPYIPIIILSFIFYFSFILFEHHTFLQKSPHQRINQSLLCNQKNRTCADFIRVYKAAKRIRYADSLQDPALAGSFVVHDHKL